MDMLVTIEDIGVSVLWFVIYALMGSFFGYRAYLCTHNQERIRAQLARNYLDMYLSDAFIWERLWPRYRRLSIPLSTLAVTGPLVFLDLPSWWIPPLIGVVIFIGFEIEAW